MPKPQVCGDVLAHDHDQHISYSVNGKQHTGQHREGQSVTGGPLASQGHAQGGARHNSVVCSAAVGRSQCFTDESSARRVGLFRPEGVTSV